MAGPASDPQRVFVNCPFDPRYKPLFDATVFAIHDLGFQARHALVTQVRHAVRLTRIADELVSCRYSIHDLSRVETSGRKRLPRFNMPFEAGIAYGLHHFASEGNEHHLLLLDAEPHRYRASLSDAAGLDPGVHRNDPSQVVARVRTFLVRASGRQGLPGERHIWRRYQAFLGLLPATASELRVTLRDLRSWEYVNDLQSVVASYIETNPA
jgi:hypothetical protein